MERVYDYYTPEHKLSSLEKERRRLSEKFHNADVFQGDQLEKGIKRPQDMKRARGIRYADTDTIVNHLLSMTALEEGEIQNLWETKIDAVIARIMTRKTSTDTNACVAKALS